MEATMDGRTVTTCKSLRAAPGRDGGRQETGTIPLHGTVEKGKLADSGGEEVTWGASGAMVRGQEETSGVMDTLPM